MLKGRGLKVFVLVTVFVNVAKGGAILRAEPVDLHPQYNYGYSVQDPLTGDFKSQQESRDGQVVQGQYSLVEPDGSTRTVTYYADHNGFNAVVDRQSAVSPVPKYAVAAPAAIATLPPLGSHHQRPIIAVQQPQIPVIQQQRPIVHPIVIQQQQRPVFPAVQPRPPVAIGDPIFDDVSSVVIESADYPQGEQDFQNPIQVPALPPQALPPGPVQIPQPTPPQNPAVPNPIPQLPLPPAQNPVQVPNPLPPQSPVQIPPVQLPPASQPPAGPATPPPTFDDPEGAIVIDASARSAGPSQDGSRSAFTYSSSRGNQFNFRIAV